VSLFKRFSFSDDPQDEHAANPGSGGANVAATGGGIAAATAAASRAAASEAASISPRRRNRRSSEDASVGARVDSNAHAALVQAELARQLEALHDPKQWAALLCMPADAAKVWTGHERWKLAQEERDTLGLTGSACARTMMITNPRGLAMLMLTSALFSAYVPRALSQLKEMAEKKKEKEKEKKTDENR
jgi:hypothetical protein